MDGTEIYHNFTNGNTSSLQAVSDIVRQLSDGYQDEANAIKALQNRMNSAWTGTSGDAAMAGANPLAQAFIDSAPPLDITTKLMTEQSDVFLNSKAKVVEVPPAPEKPSGWSVGLKAAIPIVGPSMAASDVKSYQDGVAATNAANENNVRVMQQYSAVTDSTRSAIPMDYKTLPIDGASVGLKPATPAIIEPLNHEEYVDRTSTSSSSTSTSSSSTGTVDPVRSGPNLSGPSTVTSSGHPVYIDPHRPLPSPTLPDSTTGRSNTNPSQFVPGPTGYNNSNSTTERPGTSGYRATTNVPGGSTPGRNTAAGRLYDPEGGGRGGNVSGRSGGAGESVGRGGAGEGVGRGGAAGENARSLGAGKGTGAGNVGSAAAAEEAAASRNAARGAGGAPMGAGGRRGEGAEDDEHRRPGYLIEPDPDSVFGTDVRATPPVIGE